MNNFKIQFVELDHKEERTDNILFATTAKAKNKIRAITAAVNEFKQNNPELYKEKRHSYFIDCQQV